MEIFNRYDLTVARAHGKAGKELRPASRTIDAHAHILIPEADDFVKPFVNAQTNPQTFFAAPETVEINAKQQRDRRPNLLQAKLRLADMDAMGVDVQIVMPPPPQCYYTVPLDVAIKASHMVNAGMSAFVARNPERFAALGTVPLQDGKAAADVLEHAVLKDGLKGVQILTNVNGQEISDPAFAPFWAKAEALGAIVFLHPLGFSGPRFSRSYFSNIIANPLDTTIALHALILDGVLERHPAMKIIAAHGGGFLPSYSGRIDHAWGARSDVQGSLPHLPTEYLRLIYFDGLVFTPHQLRYLVDVFGPEKILMGTDYPYDMAEMDPLGHIAAANLDNATFAAVAGGSAAKLFGLLN